MSPSPSALPVFLSVRDFSDQVGVSIKTVGRWIKAGDLRVHRLGRQLRIAKEDAAHFLASRRR